MIESTERIAKSLAAIRFYIYVFMRFEEQERFVNRGSCDQKPFFQRAVLSLVIESPE